MMTDYIDAKAKETGCTMIVLDAFTGNAELSHEAAVGRIAPEEIEYLMARGMDEEEATATIVRGFLNVNIEGLPESLAKKINETLDTFTYNKGM